MNAPEQVDEVRDELPDDINAAEFVGAYRFPDNSRRRIPGYLYLVLAGRRVPRRLPDERRFLADRQRWVWRGRRP